MSQQEPVHFGQPPAQDLATLMVRGAARLIDLHVSIAESVLYAQARSAAVLGFPDWSSAILRGNGRQMSQLMVGAAEQALDVLRNTNETACKLQQELHEILVRQISEATGQLSSGMEEIRRRAEAGIVEVRQSVQEATAAAQQQTPLQGTERSKRTTA